MSRPVPTSVVHFTHVGHLGTIVHRGLLADTDAQAAGVVAVEVGNTGWVGRWKRRPNKSRYAYWAPRIRGNKRGTPIIRVSRSFKEPPDQIPDETLKFPLWHELVHHLLPGQGHDAELCRLEALWPDSAKQDQFLDS